MEPLSVVVTTFNNEATLEPCLASVSWADEIVVLDSHSTDRTPEIARRHRARMHQQPFAGFGPQKQAAIDLASHRWVLLLDADEALSPASAREITALMQSGPTAAGYAIPRREQLYWRMASPRTRMRPFLRLFDRTRGRMSDVPVHAAPRVDGPVETLREPFWHFGQPRIEVKVDKINRNSSGLVELKAARRATPSPLMLVVYPPLYFLRNWLGRGLVFSGWAGFIHAWLDATYAFLKYAKLYEHRQYERHGARLLPEGAPAAAPRRRPA